MSLQKYYIKAKLNNLNYKLFLIKKEVYKNYLKAITLTVIAFVICNFCTAQKFYGAGGVINDYSNEFHRDLFPIEVKGLPNSIDSNFGLLSVCINITHPKVSDLKIQLMSPDGTTIWLSNRNGGNKGADYQNTCFSPLGFNGYIHESKAPFYGEFIPDSRMEFINNKQNPNDYWYLIIEDLHPQNDGQLNGFNLVFGEKPSFTPTSLCSTNDASTCICTPGNKENELLPDLVILPSFSKNQLQEFAWNDPTYPGQLRVAATIANIGEGPMEIEGSGKWICNNIISDSGTRCKDNMLARQIIQQNIYYKETNKLYRKKKKAGTMYFDEKPGHQHYHVDNWIEMRLVQKLKTKKGIQQKTIGKSNKVSYCLFDTGICSDNDSLCKINTKLYGKKNLPNYGLGTYMDCHSKAQGISVGGYDTYGMLYEGQSIQLPKKLKAGWYYLQIEVDPLHLYKEKDESNNLFEYKLFLNKQ